MEDKSGENSSAVSGSSPQDIGLLILNELQAIRREMKEGGKNMREKLDNLIEQETRAHQQTSQNISIKEQPGSSTQQ